jgi:hypothetical protein
MKLVGFVGPRIEARLPQAWQSTMHCHEKDRRLCRILQPAGDLIAIIWFDAFSIMASAIERGIVPVLVLDGELV